jgi:hypothetical protein
LGSLNLPTEIDLTTSSNEGKEKFLVLLSILVLAKLSLQNHLTQQPSSELIVSLIVNHEDNLHRALAVTVASSSIILEAYTSATFIKTDDINTTTWSTMGGKFTNTKTGICL